MKKIAIIIISGILLSVSCFADILNVDAPLVYYYQDTGLLLLDTNGWEINSLAVVFNYRDDLDGYANGSFFDNSTDNPLFEPWEGPIAVDGWKAGFGGEGVYGLIVDTSQYSSYIGELDAWCQISSGLSEDDFMYVEYIDGQGGYYKDTNVIIVPEPATMLLLGLGGIAVVRRRKF